MDRGDWQATAHGVARVGHDLVTKPPPEDQTFLQRRHTNGQQTHEKMLNITHYQRNAHENHNEVPFHTNQNGCYPKVYKQ